MMAAPRLPFLLCVALLLASAFLSLQAETYYLRPGGSDANSGTSPQEAWATLEKLNASRFLPGDSILLEAGSRFEGSIYFGPGQGGTAAAPIVISTYATQASNERALIYSGRKTGLQVYNAAGFTISRLRFEGSGRTDNTSSGIDFYLDLPDTRLAHVHIDSVEVWGYRKAGIIIGSWKGKSGYDGIRITHSEAHDNGDVGITTYAEALLGHTDLYIAYCKTYNNAGLPDKTDSHSGSGITLGGIDGGLVEFCEAYNNGWLNAWKGGGPVGIWAYKCNAVTIQYSESHHNKSGTDKDGGGFDIDGGCTNCTLQYNYAHDNDGPGYLIAQYAGAMPLTNPVIRYNISENDGRKGGYGGIHLWSTGSNGGIQNAQVYNNTVYMSPSGKGSPRALHIQSGGLKNARISNNLLVTTGGLELVYIDKLTDLRLEGNNYWSASGGFKINWGGTQHTSLGQWRQRSGQEQQGTTALGYSVDPKLKAPGAGLTIGSPGQLYMLGSYELAPDSPLADKGLDLQTLLGLDPGRQDFWGNALQGRPRLSIGAHQPTPLSRLCLQGGVVLLEERGHPQGGTYSGKGVVGGRYFDPTLVGPGQHPLTYTYTTAQGRQEQLPHSVRVLPATSTDWQGKPGSTDWFDAGNWSSCVPTPRIDARIGQAEAASQPLFQKGRSAEVKNLSTEGVLKVQEGARLEISGLFSGQELDARQATVVFAGTGTQAVTAGHYGRLHLKGGGAKALAGTVRVEAELQLDRSALRLGDHTLILAATASLAGITQNHYLITNGEGSLVLEGIGEGKSGYYPIGTAESFTPALLENKGVPDAYSLRVSEGVLTNGSWGNALSQEGVARTWHLSEGLKGGSEASLQLFWTAAEEQALFDRERSYISHFEGGVWSEPTPQAGYAQNAAEEGYYSIRLQGISSFSPFAIRNRPVPLPVTLGDFSAELQGSDALLRWFTHAEKNNKGFEVEVSEDGQGYRRLGFVASKMPDSHQRQEYRFADREPGKTGLRYYRLRQVDLDGASSYSDVRMLRFGNAAEQPRAYPNPFSGTLSLLLPARGAAEAQLSLVNAQGHPVYRSLQPLQAGTNVLVLDLQNIGQAGIYLLTIRWGDQQQQLKVVKQ